MTSSREYALSTVFCAAVLFAALVPSAALGEDWKAPAPRLQERDFDELEVIALCLGGTNPDERRGAVNALINLGSTYSSVPREVRELLERAGADPDPDVARFAAAVLASLEGRPTPPPELENRVIPPEVSFTELGDWETFLALQQELASADPELRRRAVGGLINLGSQGASPSPEILSALGSALDDAHSEVALLARGGLLGLVPELNDSLEGGPRKRLLGRLHSEQELEALIEAALGDDPEARHHALERLLEAAMLTPLAADHRVLEVFQASLADPEPVNRRFAEFALRGGLAGDENALSQVYVGAASALPDKKGEWAE